MGAAISCNATQSPIAPANVNALRPGDVSIVAALGDSLTVPTTRPHLEKGRSGGRIGQAGSAAGAQTLLDIGIQYRGLAFPIGGDGQLSSFTSIPSTAEPVSFGPLLSPSFDL